jgi:hypothetical protein
MLNYAIRATLRADVEYANTEKSVVAVEQELNTTLAIYSKVTQLVHTSHEQCENK